MNHLILGTTWHLLVYGARPPTDGEWSRYLDALEQQREDVAELIVTAGGAPMRRQREALQPFLAKRRLPAAILVERGRRAPLGADFWGRENRPWQVRVFDMPELVEALAFLRIPADRAPRIESEIARLRREAGRRPPPARSPWQGPQHAEILEGQR